MTVQRARISQGDILAVGSGSLTITPDGFLDGSVTMTVAGLDKLIALLGLNETMTNISLSAAAD